MAEKGNSVVAQGAILSLYLVMTAFNIVNPGMATLAQHFAGQDVSWFATLPKLFIVLGSTLAGALMGSKLKYRTLAICGSLFAVIFGCAPALFDSYALSLLCRAGFGLAMGLMAPLGNALIIGLYKDQKQASLLGYGTLFMNGGGILMQMLGGVLAGQGWQLMFWGHAFVAIALVMAFFLPEPEREAQPRERGGSKGRLAKAVFGIGALLFLFNVVNYPILFNLSVLFAQRGIEDPAIAATALSMYTVAGMVSGFLFGRVFKAARRWIISVGFAMAGLGALLVLMGQGALMMTVGMVCIGFGFSWFYPAFMAWTGKASSPGTIAAASAVVLAMMNLGGFVSSFWLKLLAVVAGESIVSGIVCAMVVYFVLAAAFAIRSPFSGDKQ